MTERQSIYRRYSEVNTSKIDWLWFPLIPKGKITLVQGDPGEGKSLMVLDIIAALSTGRPLPGRQDVMEPINIIYQCSEDGIEDTIKPRLLAAGADCTRIAFVVERNTSLTLTDDRLRTTIADFNASLVVIDPIQSYMGDSDMCRAGGVRKITSRLDQWASIYGCSFVLLGHLTKNESSKSLYRGIGSIDFMASARSVVQVDHLADNPKIRRLRQVKTNLTRISSELFYTITDEGRIEWLDSFPYIESSTFQENPLFEKRQTKQGITIGFLRFLLACGPLPASEILDFFIIRGIGQRTVEIAKKDAGIRSSRKDGQWFWELPGNPGEW